MVKPPVPELIISAVIRTSVCPVRFFLGESARSSESPRYTVAKQVSYHLGQGTDSGEVWGELSLLLGAASPEWREFFEECVRICDANRNWRVPSETDMKVSSDTFRIHGVVDKVFDSEPLFSIVRPTRAPASGVYASDRLRIAAYAVCLREMTGKDVDGGSVEYIPSGIARYCRVEPLDKRRFLRALHEARRIRNGGMPRIPLRPPCGKCPENGRCGAGQGTRLSDIL